jgi:prepilin-type N-terminal cleavage/methylation domain-containing protein
MFKIFGKNKKAASGFTPLEIHGQSLVKFRDEIWQPRSSVGNFSKSKFLTGFTLVELLVSIAIFTIITAVIVTNQSGFGGNILISNLAYDVALSIRQAQVYGISVKGSTLSCPSTDPNVPTSPFYCSYGVHFAAIGPGTSYYVLFVDLDGNGKYNAGADNGSSCLANSECLNFFRIERGNSIKKFCTIASRCTDSSVANRIDALDLIFKRPEPEPIIRGYKAGLLVSSSRIATITVASPQNRTKRVSISFVGQISILND